ncbi:peroxisomal targeting signal 2 receptor-like [Centruroides vittatus]|uniref:peroxisomal targeting signal 2 receptor-like n=1 Tax=Centruroides vittatus TaxID=120091 RepID=UPI0035108D1D
MMGTTLHTKGKHGYNVKFSPFFPNIIACCACENYGISGGGSLFIFDHSSGILLSEHPWKDGLFDVTWSELHENIVITGSGNGSIQFWDINLKEPVAVLHEHEKIVCSLDWSQTRAEQYLLSSSWDKTVKVWDTEKFICLSTYTSQRNYVNCVTWSPHFPGCFASVSGDGMMRIWDLKQPNYPGSQFQAHSTDVLSCDWCKYNKNIIATGGADGLIRGWDIRHAQQPIFQLTGHKYAVRRVKFSPTEESILYSVSYDLITGMWHWDNYLPIHAFPNHREFVYGLDCNAHVPQQIADCGWDETVVVFKTPTPPRIVNN